MRYEINLARQDGTAFYGGQHHLRWVHFAKVTLRTTFREEAVEAARLFSERFAGFKVTLMHWRETGEDVAVYDPANGWTSDDDNPANGWISDDDNPAFNVPDDKAAKIAAAAYDMQTLDMARD